MIFFLYFSSFGFELSLHFFLEFESSLHQSELVIIVLLFVRIDILYCFPVVSKSELISAGHHANILGNVRKLNFCYFIHHCIEEDGLNELPCLILTSIGMRSASFPLIRAWILVLRQMSSVLFIILGSVRIHLIASNF